MVITRYGVGFDIGDISTTDVSGVFAQKLAEFHADAVADYRLSIQLEVERLLEAEAAAADADGRKREVSVTTDAVVPVSPSKRHRRRRRHHV